MTPDEIFQLRLRAYSKALDRQEKQKLKKTGFVDKYDLLPNVKYFHQEGLACCRVHFGPPFPCNDPETFDYVPLNGAAEVSRLCIEPTIKGAGERMRLLHGLFRQVAQATWTRELYTTAEEDLRKIYTRWIGFEDAPESEPAIVGPGLDDVWLLRLDLGDAKVQKRVKGLLGWRD